MKTKKTQIIIASICAFLVLSIFALSLIAIFAAKSLELKGEVDMSYSPYLPENCETLIFGDLNASEYSLIPSDPSYEVTEIPTTTVNDPGVYLYYHETNKTAYVLKDGVIKVTNSSYHEAKQKYRRGLFANLTSLKEIRIDNLDISAISDISFMFYNCTGLDKISFKSFDTSNAYNMAYMFYGCLNLTTIQFDGKEENVIDFDTSNCHLAYKLFSGCEKLQSLTFSEKFIDSKVVNIADMFRGCSGLKSLNLSNFNTSQVENMSDMVRECSSLITIYVGSYWSTINVTSSSNMFLGCTSLKGGYTDSPTTYNSTKVDKTYAKIDGGPSDLGYFTEPPATT